MVATAPWYSLTHAKSMRKAPGGQVYHVLNRSVGKRHLFGKDADFEAFQRVMIECTSGTRSASCPDCVLSNDWHFAVWPDADGQVTAFFRWLAHTHAMRWRVAHRTVGYGHLYQGRFKSFPVQSDEHLFIVLRYIERNAVGAGLVARGGAPGAGAAGGRGCMEKMRSRPSYRLGRWNASAHLRT